MIERILDRLVDRLLHVCANVLDLIHAPRGLEKRDDGPNLTTLTVSRFVFLLIYLVRIGDEDGGHLEPLSVEGGPLAEFLDDLHHHSLAIRLVASLVSLKPVGQLVRPKHSFKSTCFMLHLPSS